MKEASFVVGTTAEVERARKAYAANAWQEAYESFVSADEAEPLGAGDLELLARSAYMLGHDDDYVGALERAHYAQLSTGEIPRAVRSAIWIGHSFLFRGETARAVGWFARGQRILDEDGRECVERGYLLIPVWLEQIGARDYEAGLATAMAGAEIGERFGDADLVWLARDDQSRALLQLGRVREGLRLVDEALVAATSGELSPIVTGIVFCNTISFCRDALEVRHVREWTDALTTWCDRQPQMVAHNGLCLVHRAEIMLMRGAYGEALEYARRCAERFTGGVLNQLARGKAFYCQGEVHRLRGEFSAAEEAYRTASRFGCEPQPGLALLRLTQGNEEAAEAAIRRVIGETTDSFARAALLPAYVEIMLAVGSHEQAGVACRELEQIAETSGTEVLAALAALSRGAVALAENQPSEALKPLRRAHRTWTELKALYDAARVQVMVALACRALGDEDSASLELHTARETFEQLGASIERARVDALITRRAPAEEHSLTERELEVLRLVAAGKSNREIAIALTISDHTVARHVQNIFAKLSVTSRAGATAFAFSHGIV
jgi:DNA-binding NarL/FixJ family response regulator